VVIWAVLVGIILAGMFGILPQPTQDYYLVCVAAVVVGVAAVVYRISWTHALLPHEHDTICDITGATKSHFLSYVAEHEKKVLHHDHEGRGTASKGFMGSQGVPCFPKMKKKLSCRAARRGCPAPPRKDPSSIDPRGAGTNFLGEVNMKKKMMPVGFQGDFTGPGPGYVDGYFPPEYATLYVDENMKHYYEDAQGVRRYTGDPKDSTPSTTYPDVPYHPYGGTDDGIEMVHLVRRDIHGDSSKWHPRGRILKVVAPSSYSSSSSSSSPPSSPSSSLFNNHELAQT
jgi:hypothetical protein